MICLYCQVEISPPKRKFCCKAHKDLYNHKHLYKHKYTKNYRSKSPENFISHLLSYKKRRQSISLDEVMSVYREQGGLCALSGVQMTYNQFGGKCPSNISIDRIDSTKGYELGNIQLVCALVNTMKMQYTKEELIKWCQKIVEYNK